MEKIWTETEIIAARASGEIAESIIRQLLRDKIVAEKLLPQEND